VFSTQRLPVLLVGLLAVCAAALASGAEPVTFNIEAQAMGPALRAFAEQAKVQVFYDEKVVGDARSAGVKGSYEPEAALKELLKGSDLRYERSDAKTFVIVKAGATEKSGSIKGTVADENGQPLAGIRVRALAAGTPVGTEAVADDAGVFEIADLPPGTYSLKLTLAGVPDQEQPGAEVAAGTAATVAVSVDLRRALAAVDEITVTARRIDESITAAPVPVTAITEKTIDELRLDSVPALLQLVPNATIDEGNHFLDNVSIRGVGKSSGFFGDAGYGLFRNGQFWGGVAPRITSAVDLEQLEVLRGPQGGLYGRNSIGGAMNYVFVMPRNETAAAVNLRYGTFDRVDLDAMVNLPLVEDKLYARFVGWRYGQEEGEHYNIVVDKDLDRSQDLGGRFSLKWLPASSVYVTWSYERIDSRGPARTDYYPFARPHPLAQYGYPPRPVEDKGTIWRNTFSEADTITDYLSQEIVWSGRLGELALTASYWTNTSDFVYDIDFTADQPGDYPGALDMIWNGTLDSNDLATELRWSSPADGRLRWQTGVSYYEEDFAEGETIPITMDFSLLGLGPGLVHATGLINSSQDVKSVAWYGQMQIALAEHLELTGTLRYTRDDKDYSTSQHLESENPVFLYILTPRLPPLEAADAEVFTKWSPGIDLAYRPSETLTVYGRIATGFRAGGFNLYVSDPAYVAYQEETSINYEAGIKTELLDRRLRLGVSAFRLDQEDLLQRVPDPGWAGFSYLVNAGEAQTDGLEGELDARISRELEIGIALGWLDAKYTEGQLNPYAGGAPIDAAGLRVLSTPEYTGNLRVMWAHPLSSGLSLVTNASATFRSDSIVGYGASGTEDFVMDSFARFDLTAGITTEHWQILAFAENLSNDESLVMLLPDGAVDRRQGRTYGLKLGYRMH
jgi:iron complex outermembrane receptor protein